MIYSITGKIIDRANGSIAIENNGIAFSVNVPDNSYAFIAPEDEQITLYTSMIVREDDISLYGFTDKASLAMFKLLLGISGIGAKAALSILSVASVSAIKQAIEFEDVDLIQTANGIGKKTAQRVILELKDKINKNEVLQKITNVESANTKNNSDSNKASALDALIALGYSRSEASTALIGIKANTVEEYISQALRNK